MDWEPDPSADITDELLAETFDKLVALTEYENFSWRELRLLANYINPNSPGYSNLTRSAMLAGFTGTYASLRSTASRIYRKAKKCGLEQIILEEHGASLHRAAEKFSEGLDAQRPDGTPDHRLRFDVAKFTYRELTRDVSHVEVRPAGFSPTPPAGEDTSTQLVPEQLTPELEALRHHAKTMDPRSRMMLGEVIGAEQEVIRAKLGLAKLQEHSLDAESGQEGGD